MNERIHISQYTHIDDNKFLSVNIFQNIVSYTHIYVFIYVLKYSVPSVESFKQSYRWFFF